ncbi:hypothetical protein G5V65_00210 [Rhodobacter sp. HX-7-19]|uniref:Uncharacterized protein n=1 Tax=Paragemmobacter kunshanensis TaxID=2583234 RepID=A0A6M1TND8_9RHOB|nr:hypothetical protein [Rhodobacter kunshanensis]NGQ89300.1 hypothetical protein [Rhodobacter kunshanensis]
MTALYLTALAASALLLTIAFRMERSAIRQRINGAGGLTLLAAFITSASATIPVAALAWWADGPTAAAIVLLISALWHLAAWRLALGRLQSLIAARAADPTKASP